MATNTVNNKKYIGYDSAWPRRMKGHLTAAYSGRPAQYKQRFHAAIRKYGKENFTWEVLYQSLDCEHTLMCMEEYFIREHRTFCGFDDCNGYNLTLGGEGLKGKIMSVETRAKKSASLINKPTCLSREVSTPHGVFSGVKIAARALGLNVRTIYERIARSSFVDWYYTDEPRAIASQSTLLGYAREIATPFGVFESVRACSIATAIPTSTITSRLDSPFIDDWTYTGNQTKKGLRRVHTPNGVFDSVALAELELNINRSTIHARIRSTTPNTKEWYYV